MAARELIGWYFDTVGPDAVVNNRWGLRSDVGFLTPEYSAGIEVTDRPWAEVRGLGRSFGLNRNEKLDAYTTPGALVRRFVNAVAAGGGMILNVGPRADGQIPLLQQECLVQLGEWLDVNGAAIYGSSPWQKLGEDREVVLERVDPAIDFDWVLNTPGEQIREDDFNAIWTGYIEPRFSETYFFEFEADDGICVWIDGALVADGWEHGDPASGSGATPVDGSMDLVAGHRHAIRVAFHEEKENARARLFWSSPSQPREIVPRDRLFTTADPTGNGLRAEYRSQQRYLAYTRKDEDLFAIFFEWPDRYLELPIREPSPGTTIRLLGLDRDPSWRYENNTLYVDLSSVAFREIPGRWAWTVQLAGYDDLPR